MALFASDLFGDRRVVLDRSFRRSREFIFESAEKNRRDVTLSCTYKKSAKSKVENEKKNDWGSTL